MNTAISFAFLLFALTSILLLRCVPGRLRATLVFPMSNLAFLLLVMPSFLSLALIFGFIAVSYGGVKIAEKRNPLYFIVAITGTLLIFFYLKSYPIISQLPFSNKLPVLVGLSYILIRCLQVMIDCYQGELAKTPDFLRFLQFTISWPTLLSGPIMSYRQFAEQLEGMKNNTLSAESIYEAFTNIVIGAFSVIVLGGFAFLAYDHFQELIFKAPLAGLMNTDSNTQIMALLRERGSTYIYFIFSLMLFGAHLTHPAGLALTAIFYLFFLYFNFAGYTRIVIGLGRLVGLNVPENFNFPWACRNFLNLWTRWHMTLANWFKSYVFNPITKELLVRWPSGNLVPYYSVVAYFITFFLVGLWHGPTVPYVLCGVALGFGVSANKLWQIKIKSILGKESLAKLNASWWYISASSASAMAYLAFSIIPFWASDHALIKLLLVFGLWGVIYAALIALTLILPISIIALRIEPHLRAYRSNALHPVIVGCLLASVLVCLSLLPNGSSGFVYQRF